MPHVAPSENENMRNAQTILNSTLKVMNVFFMNHRGHRDHREFALRYYSQV